MGDYFVKMVEASNILEKLIIKENIFLSFGNFDELNRYIILKLQRAKNKTATLYKLIPVLPF